MPPNVSRNGELVRLVVPRLRGPGNAWLLVAALALACLLPRPAAAAESYALAVTAQAPVIDGNLDEACWTAATVLDRFVLLGGAELPPDERVGTRAMLTADSANLYLGVVCEEPFAERLSMRHTQRDSDVWQDDDIEFMVMPCAQGVDRYVQLCINPAGALMDGYLPGRAAKMDKGYDSEAEIKTRVGAKEWTLELRLPLANLPVQSFQGPWYFHVARARRTTSQYLTSLQTSVSGFHETNAFAELTGIEKLNIPFGVKDFTLGDIMYGANACTLAVEGDKQRLSSAEIEIDGQKRAIFDAPALAIQTGTLKLEFNVVPGDQGKTLNVRLLDGATLVQRRSTVLGNMPVDLLGKPTKSVLYFSPNEFVELELPVNVLGSQKEPLKVTWTASDDQGGVTGSGETVTTGKSARIRLYWQKWRPGAYKIDVKLCQGGKEIASRTHAIRLILNPWEEMR
ncbi:MAG: hypothetical protein A3K19_05815 [Lentisphaerae bacterium RIFOXYB12_FULL_65_16]|nr:MAG: hypothetical protein A3K18_15430 [Lentisphaerae bacterium RIFOXYA12_64_32]OGV95089.1 MAG: hypothetical protein A3K19_05815 [Lentisphaerae bacterium RIFOXYB12_FULL_65_16]